MKYFLLIILVAIGAGLFIFSNGNYSNSLNLASFAECLRDQGAVMYGADWCPHCQNEKKAFGDSFKLVPYVECPDDPKRCLAAGINGYPTWIFPDGKRLEGEQGLEKLSRESGCQLEE